MVFCRGCGKEIHETAVFCPSCGAPQNSAKTGDKNKVVAALLAFFLGFLGIHRFYLGQWWGLFYLLFCWTMIPTLISFIETIVFLLSNQQKWDNKYNGGIPSSQGSGAVIVIVLLVVIFGGVFVLGILAAVAIPSYQDYTARAQVTEGISLLANYKTSLREYYQQSMTFTGLTTDDLTGTTEGKYVSSITIESASDSDLTLAATFKDIGVNARISGLQIRLSTSDGGLSWECGEAISDIDHRGNMQIEAKYMPSACK